MECKLFWRGINGRNGAGGSSSIKIGYWQFEWGVNLFWEPRDYGDILGMKMVLHVAPTLTGWIHLNRHAIVPNQHGGCQNKKRAKRFEKEEPDGADAANHFALPSFNPAF
jgi:hypothetical protein